MVTPERAARVKEARRLGAWALEERAQMGLEAASDNFKLQRAKEVAHHLRWKASKLDPGQFGDKIQHAAAVDLPPLPPQPATTVSVTLELPPAEAYAQMLARKG